MEKQDLVNLMKERGFTLNMEARDINGKTTELILHCIS